MCDLSGCFGDRNPGLVPRWCIFLHSAQCCDVSNLARAGAFFLWIKRRLRCDCLEQGVELIYADCVPAYSQLPPAANQRPGPGKPLSETAEVAPQKSGWDRGRQRVVLLCQEVVGHQNNRLPSYAYCRATRGKCSRSGHAQATGMGRSHAAIRPRLVVRLTS